MPKIYDIIGYSLLVDHYCINCANEFYQEGCIKVLSEDMPQNKDIHGIPYNGIDRYGDKVTPILVNDTLDLDESLYCGACGEYIYKHEEEDEDEYDGGI